MKYRVFEGGYPLERAHFDDAGIDIRTPEGFVLNPNENRTVDTKIAVQIPIGYFGKLESKSGLNVNHSIITTGGVVDSGFRGTIKVKLFNFGNKPYEFKAGDKITQLVLIPVLLADLEQVDELDDSESGRNASGWGSTGR